MTWPTSNLAVAGTTIPESDHNELRADLAAINGFVRKTADESVTSSAALQNDDHLLFTIPAAGTYVIDMYLQVTSAANAAGDISLAFTYPTGTNYTFTMGADNTLASGHISGAVEVRSDSIASGTIFSNFGASTAPTNITVRSVLVATASGTFRLQWCQQVSNANATTVKAGSHMTMKQVE